MSGDGLCASSMLTRVLSIHFLLEDEHHWNSAGHWVERTQCLLDCIGIRRHCRHFLQTGRRQSHEQSAKGLEKEICYLKQELADKVMNAEVLIYVDADVSRIGIGF